MKRFLVSAALAVGLVAMLSSCAAAFQFDAKSLGGQILTYMGSDGLSSDVFTFAADGLSGTWESKGFRYGYATAEASAGDYTKKTWFQSYGNKSKFTYNPETFEFSSELTDQWARSDAAVLAGTSWAADYLYRPIIEAAGANDGVTYSAYSLKTTVKVLFTQDNCSLASTGNFEQSKGSMATSSKMGRRSSGASVLFVDGGAWTAIGTTVTASTLDNVTTVDTITSSTSFTVSGTELLQSTKLVESTVVGDAAPDLHTEVTNTSYKVNACYIVGDTETSAAFADAWKDGNIVSFAVTNIKDEFYNYDGDTAPAAPTTFDLYGYGSVSTGTSYYRIDYSQYSSMFSYTKNEGYIAASSFYANASRDL